MKRLLAVLALLLSAPSASAAPEGAWPEEARAISLGRPAWVLVVPAVRDANGGFVLWDRTSPWSRAWTVPKATPSGIRTVAITGDSEDQKLIHAAQIDNMSSESLRMLARKYEADAVAVVVQDQLEAVAVAAWRTGRHATWDTPATTGDPRKVALDTMDTIFSGSGTTSSSARAEVRPDGVRILAQRMSADGYRMEYRLEAGQREADAISVSPSLSVKGSGEGTVDVIVLDGRAIEDVIHEVGLDIR